MCVALTKAQIVVKYVAKYIKHATYYTLSLLVPLSFRFKLRKHRAEDLKGSKPTFATSCGKSKNREPNERYFLIKK